MQVAIQTLNRWNVHGKDYKRKPLSHLTRSFFKSILDNDIKHFVGMKNCSFSMDTFSKREKKKAPHIYRFSQVKLDEDELNDFKHSHSTEYIHLILCLIFFSFSFPIFIYGYVLSGMVSGLWFCCLYRNKCNALCSINLTLMRFVSKRYSFLDFFRKPIRCKTTYISCF